MVNQINYIYQPYQTVFREKNKTGWWKILGLHFYLDFLQRVTSSSLKICLNNWVALLNSWKTTTKMVHFYCFLSKNHVTLCNVMFHQINRLGGRWIAGRWIFCFFSFFSVDMVDMVQWRKTMQMHGFEFSKYWWLNNRNLLLYWSKTLKN